MAGLLSTITVTSVGLTCKAFLKLGFCSVTVKGLPILLDALESEQRNKGQGVITVGNHISTLDDPLAWGILPAKYYLNSRKTRWALGASDIMFTNPFAERVFSAFFHLGQTLETFRGKGVYQPAVDIAIRKLNEGGWVHLFCEGKVNQPHCYPQKNDVGSLPRFKWGVGRILMETAVPPMVIPMWLTGFDTLMPEGRSFPYNFIPQPGADLSITFGHLRPEKIKIAMLASKSKETTLSSKVETRYRQEISEDIRGTEARYKSHVVDKKTHVIDENVRVIRSDVTAIVQRAVEALGREVSGHTLRNR